MTTGALLPKVLLFSAPLILSGVLQLLFNAADIIVVGKFAGDQAMAAVGSTGSLINLLVNVFMGLSVGASVLVARAWGAQDFRGVQTAVHTSVSVAGIAGVFVALLGLVLGRPLLVLMKNPPDVIDGATLYITIYFLGMPFNMLYNFGAAILRAVGDTRRPLYYLIIAGVLNVLLNLLLVIVFHMGVAGVAIATVFSQAVSCVLVMACLIRSEGAIHLDLHKLRIDLSQLKEIARIGLPAGLQGSLFSISNVLIQSTVNSFGSVVVAGNTASSNLEGFVYTAMNALYQAAITFSSQNMGAKKYARVHRSMWVCLGVVLTVGLASGLLMTLLGPVLLHLYTDNPEVIDYGMVRMRIILPTYFICGMMDTMVGQLRGVGQSILPMLVSLTGACALRIVWILTVFAANPTLPTLYWSYPVSWTVTLLAHVTCYFIATRKMPRQDLA
ncbi:MAG: MATE family efflux transporter [Clostridia bacterium]|nr:MATE family efflux transporter [Clostridia bacterium]